MELDTILKAEAVKVVSSATSKKRLFRDLSETAASAYGLDCGVVLDRLLERESLGPTGVGHGVALPHARLAGLDNVLGLFILLEKPLDYESVDRQPVDLIFALFAPEDSGVEHLKALALVSRTLRNTDFCTKLRANPSSDTLYTILTETQAAIRAA
ncbi:PTS sugar transporter subunit IIA [Cognatishimia sp. MH4019]|uniref:PTS sugar transporter subunit IIA n=1 Tax=Cognatishimia sp. MH4019 TaxID=2854030 RepID=UPI001CD567B7|nr:PTS sugar transporter subunit IIA [Cognatishimia sp. MH4019]